mmetsp:Transcript_5393/g.12251  ORF Transcript_5393/g.12251 Transcript_5393/m.12251 type:complete len:94 (-) Transcript_5393:165-446(-)
MRSTKAIYLLLSSVRENLIIHFIATIIIRGSNLLLSITPTPASHQMEYPLHDAFARYAYKEEDEYSPNDEDDETGIEPLISVGGGHLNYDRCC